MIYPKDFEHKIGFSPLRTLLLDKCETKMGQQLVHEMGFDSNFDSLKKKLGCVEEMRKLITSNLSLPQFSFHNIASWFK